MASIRTGIELQDNFSNVLTGIINSVNIAISAMTDMQQTMNANIDTSSLDAARDQINRATIAADELSRAMQNVGPTSTPDTNVPTPPTSRSPTPEPIQPRVQWQSDGIEVFNTSGLERYRQEVHSVNAILEQLGNTQEAIATQAANTDVLSSTAINDINSLGTRIDGIRNRIQQIENNPLNVGTNTANAELERLACIAISVEQTKFPDVMLALPEFSLVKHPEAGESLG